MNNPTHNNSRISPAINAICDNPDHPAWDAIADRVLSEIERSERDPDDLVEHAERFDGMS